MLDRCALPPQAAVDSDFPCNWVKFSPYLGLVSSLSGTSSVTPGVAPPPWHITPCEVPGTIFVDARCA
jgi:hypothetical protein